MGENCQLSRDPVTVKDISPDKAEITADGCPISHSREIERLIAKGE